MALEAGPQRKKHDTRYLGRDDRVNNVTNTRGGLVELENRLECPREIVSRRLMAARNRFNPINANWPRGSLGLSLVLSQE